MNSIPSIRNSSLSGALLSLLSLAACGGGGAATADLTSSGANDGQRSVNQSLVAGDLSLVADADPLQAFELAQMGMTDLPIGDDAPAPAPVTTGIAKPRVALLWFPLLSNTAIQQSVARFDFVITGIPSDQQWIIDGVRKFNPSIKLANYTVLVEAKSSVPTTSSAYPDLQALDANDWWLYNADGEHTRWTTAYDTYLTNITAWAPKDSLGRRYPEYLGDRKASLFGRLKGLDYIYVDNVWYMPRPRSGATSNMDWKRIGTNQSSSDPDIISAHRTGMAVYFDRLRSKMPGVKVMGNADALLSYPEYKGKLQGSFIECAFGKSWSLLNKTNGWQLMMSRYRDHLASTTAPKDVVLQGCAPNGVDLPALRFGLASALLEDGWFTYTYNWENPPVWADEYSAPLGTAAEPPPDEPTSSGIWMRKYTNGIVLVNPGTSTASVNIGPGYKRLKGTQDPVVNNGLAVSTVTLLPNQGLIVVKQ